MKRIKNLNNYLSLKASIPGRRPNSIYSKEAPPPVDKCENFSCKFKLLIADRESPPPTIVTAPWISDIILAIALVPFAKFGNSKTPNGPFQKIVLPDSKA